LFCKTEEQQQPVAATAKIKVYEKRKNSFIRRKAISKSVEKH
jgi:hypothetical protein